MQTYEKKQKVTSYQHTDVTPDESIKEINDMLIKFGAGNIGWVTVNPEASFIVFGCSEKEQHLIFKIPFPTGIHNEAQALRILYHKIKALMIDLELGSKVYEVFANNLVVEFKGSIPISVQERNTRMIAEGNANQIYLGYKQNG